MASVKIDVSLGCCFSFGQTFLTDESRWQVWLVVWEFEGSFDHPFVPSGRFRTLLDRVILDLVFCHCYRFYTLSELLYHSLTFVVGAFRLKQELRLFSSQIFQVLVAF